MQTPPMAKAIPANNPIAPPAPVPAATQIGNKLKVADAAPCNANADPIPAPKRVPPIAEKAKALRLSIPAETLRISSKVSSCTDNPLL